METSCKTVLITGASSKLAPPVPCAVLGWEDVVVNYRASRAGAEAVVAGWLPAVRLQGDVSQVVTVSGWCRSPVHSWIFWSTMRAPPPLYPMMIWRV